MTTTLDKILYTAKAHSKGGRDGSSRTDDGLLDVKLDPLRATAQSLPASVLSISPIVTPTRPLTTTVGTIDLTVAPAAPPCIPPGEYTGGLRALVAGQTVGNVGPGPLMEQDASAHIHVELKKNGEPEIGRASV